MNATISTSRRGRRKPKPAGNIMRKGTENVLSMRQSKKNDKRSRRRGAEPTRNNSLRSSKLTHMSSKLTSVNS